MVSERTCALVKAAICVLLSLTNWSVASVDKFPEALGSFADLNAETAQHGIAWNVLFVAAMNREENEGADQIAAVDQTLEAMVSAIKAGQVDAFVPFDPSGAVVAMGA